MRSGPAVRLRTMAELPASAAEADWWPLVGTMVEAKIGGRWTRCRIAQPFTAHYHPVRLYGRLFPTGSLIIALTAGRPDWPRTIYRLPRELILVSENDLTPTTTSPKIET